MLIIIILIILAVGVFIGCEKEGDKHDRRNRY